MIKSELFQTNTSFLAKVVLILLSFFVFLLPWGDSLFSGFPRLIGIILAGASIILFLIQGVRTSFGIFHFLVLLYTSWIVISLMWSSNHDTGFNDVITTLQLMLFTFLVTFIIDSNEKKILLYQSYVFGCVVTSSELLWNFAHGITSPHHWNRYVIDNLEIDTLSVILALAIPLSAYLAIQTNNKLLKTIYVAAIPFNMFGIFLTGTRTGFIIGLLGIFYWFFTHRKSSLNIKALIVIISLISITLIISFAPKFSVNRIFSAGKSISSGTLNDRTLIWNGTINQWKNSPIIGTGIGGLGDVLSREHLNYGGAHNTYLQLLAETGLIGLTLYLLVLLSLLYYILQPIPIDEKVFLLILFFAMVLSQMSLHLHTEKFLWVFYSLIPIHTLYYKRENNLNVIPT